MKDAFAPVVREAIDRSENDQVVIVLRDAHDIRDVKALRFGRELDAWFAKIGAPKPNPTSPDGKPAPFEPLRFGFRWVLEFAHGKPLVVKAGYVSTAPAPGSNSV